MSLKRKVTGELFVDIHTSSVSVLSMRTPLLVKESETTTVFMAGLIEALKVVVSEDSSIQRVRLGYLTGDRVERRAYVSEKDRQLFEDLGFNRSIERDARYDLNLSEKIRTGLRIAANIEILDKLLYTTVLSVLAVNSYFHSATLNLFTLILTPVVLDSLLLKYVTKDGVQFPIFLDIDRDTLLAD